MLKKIFKFSIYFIILITVLLTAYYFFRVYVQNEQILISKNNLHFENSLKSFISKRIQLDENKIKFTNVELKISKLNNFLSFTILNVKLFNNVREVIYETENLNLTISYLDFFNNIINRDKLLFKHLIIDNLNLSLIRSNGNIKIDNSLLLFKSIFSENKTDNRNKIKIKNLNIKIIDKENNLKQNLIFSCTFLDANRKYNFDERLLSCYENNHDVELVFKRFIKNENSFLLLGRFKNLKLDLFDFELNGILNSDFEISFSKKFEIFSIDFTLLNQSQILKRFKEKKYKFSLLGNLNYDIYKKHLTLKNFEVNDIPINGKLKSENGFLNSDLSIKIHDKTFNIFDSKYLKIIDLNFPNANVETLKKFKDNISLKNSILNFKSLFNTKQKKFNFLKINSSGNFSASIKNYEFKKIIKLNSTIFGNFNLNYNNGIFDVEINGNLKETILGFKQKIDFLNLHKINYSININNDYLEINNLNIINNKNNILDIKSKFWRVENDFKLGYFDAKLNKLPAELFLFFYNIYDKKNKLYLQFDEGEIVNSKIFIKSKNNSGIILDKKIEVINLNFLNIINYNKNLIFKKLKIFKKNKNEYFGNTLMELQNIPIKANFELNKQGQIKAYGEILNNTVLKEIIYNNSLLTIQNLDQIKFKTTGNLKTNDYQFKISSILDGSSLVHKILNIKEEKIQHGYFEADLNFKKGRFTSMKNFKINFDTQKIFINFNFDKLNLIKFENFQLKSFKGKLLELVKNDNFWRIKIDGEFIDISHLAEDFIDQRDNYSPKIKFDVVAKKIILNKNFSISGNLKGTFENNKFTSLGKGKFFLGSNTLLDAGELSINVSKDNYFLEGFGLLEGGDTKMTIISSKNNLPTVTFDTFTGGKLLSALNFTNKIKSGKMNLKIKFLNDDLTRYEGKISVNNFKIINAPKIIKSLTSISFSGISSLFVGEGVFFKKGDAIFYKEDNNLTFNNIFVNNESLSVILKGVYNFKNKEVDFIGSMAPFKTISQIISVVPAVGELLTGSKKEGLIAGQFKLKGKIYDPEVDLNVLSFTPGILREIFSKDWLK